jgi:competence protein ComEC
MLKRKEKFILFVLGILFFLNILAWWIVFDLSKPQFLEVNFFDVGQGDAIFIQTPQRHQILIDGGPDSKILEKLAKEMPFWDRSIDLIILTHPERDHLVGLIEVLKSYNVENIFWTGIKRDIPEFKEWEEAIKNEKAKVFIAKAGQKIIFQNGKIEILFPFESLENQILENSNDTSIVTKLNFNQNSFFFTGDISKSAEEELVNHYQNLKSDVLKVAHHGSKNSNSVEFLEKVLPDIAVISVGKKDDSKPDCDNKERNPYGHPNCEVLERLKNFGTNILRTDEDGDIKIISDGEAIKIKNQISKIKM